MNGVSEILWIADNKLLIVERSFSMGRASSTVKVYVADLNGATNIMNVPSLKVKAPERVVSKRLLLDMNDLGFYVDNIEGVTFGPILPNGNKSIIFMADNNFNPLERSQFFLFEVTHE